MEVIIVKKEDILIKAKNAGLDEREAIIYLHSFGIGGIAVCILAVVFSVWNAIHGEQFYEFSAFVFAYLSATDFYKYKNLKNKLYLINSILTGVFTIILIVMFFVQG